MKPSNKLLLSLLSLFIGLQTFGQIMVDLSDKSKSTESIETTKSVLTIRNLIPGKGYTFEIEKDEEQIPAFSTKLLSSDNITEDGINSVFIVRYDSLRNCNDESLVPGLINNLKEEMDNLRKVDERKYAYCLFLGTEVLNKTTLQKELQFKLRNNQTITVIVKRQVNKDSTVTWTKIFKTPQKSPWLIHFGFTYQPNFISRYVQYFAKEDTSAASRYTIIRKNGNQAKFWENISPTIMFSYPITNKNGDSHLAFSAIAATNFSTFSAGSGLSYIIGKNVALGTGVMFTQKYVLNGIYKEGEIIKTNLTYEQLHEKKWGPEIYFTIGLRFDKNPFTGSTQKTTADGKKENETGNE